MGTSATGAMLIKVLLSVVDTTRQVELRRGRGREARREEGGKDVVCFLVCVDGSCVVGKALVSEEERERREGRGKRERRDRWNFSFQEEEEEEGQKRIQEPSTPLSTKSRSRTMLRSMEGSMRAVLGLGATFCLRAAEEDGMGEGEEGSWMEEAEEGGERKTVLDSSGESREGR